MLLPEDLIEIEGFPYYAITKDGKVFSLQKGDYLIPRQSNWGYLRVGIRKKYKGKRIFVSIHRLVANAFIPNDDHKPEVNHIDGNKENNSVGNLEWCTKAENIQHSYRCGAHKAMVERKKKEKKDG